MNAIADLVYLEEGWDLVVGNQFVMERDILDMAAYEMIYSHFDWHKFNDVRMRFIRHLQNLLSSCRSYLDHTPQALDRLDRTGDLKRLFKMATQRAYDDSFAYRFMEALRNHAQHSGHPIHGAMFDARRVEQEHGTAWRYIAGATIDLDVIAKNPKFKIKVLQEAKILGNKMDAIFLAREYVEKLNEVHLSIRAKISELGLSKKDSIVTIQQIYKEAGGALLGLRAFERLANDTIAGACYIFDEPFERFERLCSRNGSLHNFSKRYASGELLVRNS